MIYAKIISEKYQLKLVGDDKLIENFASLKNQSNNTLIWCKSKTFISEIKSGIALIPEDFVNLVNPNKNLTLLICEKSPRLIFAKILNDFFKDSLFDDYTNHVDQHKKNHRIRIGENCFIGANVIIGDGTEILHNTSIFSNTVIGSNCHINTNCSVGTPGLGFEYDGDEMIKFPQLGGVEIKQGVEIGPNSTIRRGALDNTVIGAYTKIGSLSNIGHNCQVGEQCILTCQIVLGGSTTIGNKVFMGINSITKNKVIIGEKVTVAMGAVVTKNVENYVTVAGIPAKVISS